MEFEKKKNFVIVIQSLVYDANIFKQGGKDAEQQKAVQDRARQQEDAKHSILTQIMDQNARARCEYFFFIFFCNFCSL